LLGGASRWQEASHHEQISFAAVFLASNESRYVSSEVYGVTGGKMPY
jgi:hypothetical protein